MLRNVYILSAGRSGSTLLSLILGGHPRAISVGELYQLPKNLALNTTCACGQPIRDCSFWNRVVANLDRHLHLQILKNPYSLDLGFIGAVNLVDRHHQTAAYRVAWQIRHELIRLHLATGLPLPDSIVRRFAVGIDNTLATYGAIRNVSGADYIIDSSKGYLRGISIYQRDPSSTRLVLLARDGRARLYSGLKTGHNRRQTVRGWRTYYDHALPLLEKHVAPSDIIHVRYEQLARNPQAETHRLCDFLGLPFDPLMLDFRHKTSHVANGNDMRLVESDSISLDERWRSSLSADDLAFFEKHAGPVNRRLGYNSASRSVSPATAD